MGRIPVNNLLTCSTSNTDAGNVHRQLTCFLCIICSWRRPLLKRRAARASSCGISFAKAAETSKVATLAHRENFILKMLLNRLETLKNWSSRRCFGSSLMSSEYFLVDLELLVTSYIVVRSIGYRPGPLSSYLEKLPRPRYRCSASFCLERRPCPPPIPSCCHTCDLSHIPPHKQQACIRMEDRL